MEADDETQNEPAEHAHVEALSARLAGADCAVWTGKTQADSLGRHIFEMQR